MAHNYKLGDEVFHPCDAAPFKIVGIRENEIEIEGDWSGGTHNVSQKDWVTPQDIKPYDRSKVVYYLNGKPYKNGEALQKCRN